MTLLIKKGMKFMFCFVCIIGKSNMTDRVTSVSERDIIRVLETRVVYPSRYHSDRVPLLRSFDQSGSPPGYGTEASQSRTWRS